MEPAVSDNRLRMIVNRNVGVKIAHAGELLRLPSRDDMKRIVKCQICSGIPVAPIYICVNGHSICSSCNSRASNCGRCNGRLNGVRNYSLEGIINASTFNCKYGCLDVIKGENVIKHSAECNCRPPPGFQGAQQERQQQSDVPYISFPSSDSSDDEMNRARSAGLFENNSNIFFRYLCGVGGTTLRTYTTMALPPPPPQQPNANTATASQPIRQTARMSTRPAATTTSASHERRTPRRSTTGPRQAMAMSVSTPPPRGPPSQSTTTATGVPPTAAEQRTASSTASSTRTVRGSTPPAHRTRARMAISISSSESL